MTPQDMKPTWTEQERLAAVHRTGLLDSEPEQAYDDLVRLAAELTGAPMAGIHLVAEGRQWGKAEIGLGTRHIPREIAFCSTAMLEPDGLVVPDARRDPRFADNPLVTGGPGIRFYAGVPLISEGLPVGALCVIDTEPREAGLDERQRFAMKALAAQVGGQIALRRALAERNALLAERERADTLRRQTLDSAVDFAIISTDLDGTCHRLEHRRREHPWLVESGDVRPLRALPVHRSPTAPPAYRKPRCGTRCEGTRSPTSAGTSARTDPDSGVLAG